MKRLLVFLLLLPLGCASTPRPAAHNAPLQPGEVLSAKTAHDGLVVGRSTKAEVRAALGEPVAIDFDSGYEVWVYRERLKEKAPPPSTELVLLFAPSGILARKRVSPPP